IIGARPLFRIRHLQRENAGESLRSHSWTRQNPFPLRFRRRRYDECRIHFLDAAFPEQPRYVEHHQLLIATLAQELAARLANSRMDDRVEPFERLWIAGRRPAAPATLNSGRAGAAGECGLN